MYPIRYSWQQKLGYYTLTVIVQLLQFIGVTLTALVTLLGVIGDNICSCRQLGVVWQPIET